jgi:hypothetical protein
MVICTIAPGHIIKLKSNPIISVDKDTPVKMRSAVLLPLGLIILVLRLKKSRSFMLLKRMYDVAKYSMLSILALIISKTLAPAQ